MYNWIEYKDHSFLVYLNHEDRIIYLEYNKININIFNKK